MSDERDRDTPVPAQPTSAALGNPATGDPDLDPTAPVTLAEQVQVRRDADSADEARMVAEHGPVTTRWRYSRRFGLGLALSVLGEHAVTSLVHRTDHHEDGSQSESYFLELGVRQYANVKGVLDG